MNKLSRFTHRIRDRFQVPISGREQWALDGKHICAAFRSGLPPLWLRAAAVRARLRASDDNTSNPDPILGLTLALKARMRANVNAYLEADSQFDIMPVLCDDSSIVTASARFVNSIGKLYLSVPSHTSEGSDLLSTKRNEIRRLLRELRTRPCDIDVTVERYMETDRADSRVASACGTWMLQDPNLVDKVKDGISRLSLDPYSGSVGVTAFGPIRVLLEDGLDSIGNDVVTRFLVEALTDEQLSTATSFGDDHFSKALKREKALRPLRIKSHHDNASSLRSMACGTSVEMRQGSDASEV